MSDKEIHQAGEIASLLPGLQLLGRYLEMRMPVGQALDLLMQSFALGAAGSPPPFWLTMLARVESGWSLSGSLAASGGVERALIDQLAAAEANGTLPSTLARAGMAETSPSDEVEVIEEVEGADGEAMRAVTKAYDEGEPVVRLVSEILREGGRDVVQRVAWGALPDDALPGPTDRGEHDRPVWVEEDGHWTETRRIPQDLFDRAVRRVLLMSGIPYWATGEAAGTISLRTGGASIVFTVVYASAPARLLLTRRHGEGAE